MFVKVHKPSQMPGGDNKGSSAKLINYLEKENNDKDGSDKEHFFNHSDDKIKASDAEKMIDRNNKNLGKNDYKFYMLSVNPSHREQQHMIEKITGKKVESLDELTPKEQAKFFAEVKAYSNEVMGDYARNFGRSNVNSEKDLVYVAKVETVRKYKHYDKEVKHNSDIITEQQKLKREYAGASKEEAKKLFDRIEKLESQLLRTRKGKVIEKDTLKDGLNVHVHVVVSRNNVKQDTKLSPLSKSRGGEQTLNGEKVRQGFNHEEFKSKASDRFNERYGYKPTDKEKYEPKKKKNSSSSSSDKSKNKKTVLNIARNIDGKMKALLTEGATSGTLRNERLVVQNTMQIIKNVKMLIVSPQAAVISIAKQLASKIISTVKDKS